jgi:eukaryotic-like serine/threonine-protein kinase
VGRDTESGSAQPGSDDSFERLLRDACQVRAPAPGFGVGSTLLEGRFQVRRRIGEGAMGVVFEAHDAQRSALVALKTVSRLDAAGVYRLKNEFRSLADVSHRHLCSFHELFEMDGQWFFTMELIDGVPFDQWVRPNGALDEARLREGLVQLYDGVEALHAHGKLHRDLKPSNVLVGRDARLVVLDFGLAIDPEPGGVGHTLLHGDSSGTPAYMAPEQAAGRSAVAASDYYAIGVMLFEALSGHLPFEGRGGEIASAKQTRDAPTPEHGPADLVQLCTLLLQRDPSRRPRATLLASLAKTPTQENDPQLPSASGNEELLGRVHELAALREAYAHSVAGQPVAVFVSGEAGIGKSALVAAFLSELRTLDSAVVLAGRCYERENVPFKGIDALIDDLSRYLRRLSDVEATARLPRDAHALARVFPVLERVDAVANAPRRESADPLELKRRAHEAFGELLVRMRDRGPLVLFIDDVQWLDEDAVSFMRALFSQPQLVPLLFVCAHRSEGASENSLLQAMLQTVSDNPALELRTLEVGALADDALIALARRLLPADASATRAKQLAQEAAGSPFFTAALVRAAALVDAGSPTPSLEQALELHMAALREDARCALDLLGLAGQPLEAGVVVEAGALATGHAALDQLRRERLARTSRVGGLHVECYHDKIREHVARALDPARRAELSGALADALLARSQGEPELIMRCLALAGRRSEAALQAVRAADVALGASAFARAEELYAYALEEGVFDPDTRQRLRVSRADAARGTGHGERAGNLYLEAAHTASAVDRGELLRRAGEALWLGGNTARGRVVMHDAMRSVRIRWPRSLGVGLVVTLVLRAWLRLRGIGYVARAAHDAKTLRQLEALWSCSNACTRCDPAFAASFAIRLLLAALRAGHEVYIARALCFEVYFGTVFRTPDALMERRIALCRELAERVRDDPMMSSWELLLVTRLFWSGDTSAAVDVATRGFQRLATHLNVLYDRNWARAWYALSLIGEGRMREAADLAEGTLQEARAQGDVTVCAALTCAAVMALVATGRSELARRRLAEAVATLREDQVTPHEAWLVPIYNVPDLACGEGMLDGWRANAALRDRYLRSIDNRLLFRGSSEFVFACRALGVMERLPAGPECAAVERQARTYMRAARMPFGAITGSPAFLRACLRADRAGAIAALRAYLRGKLTPISRMIASRHLGLLVGGEEGARLVEESDHRLRAGGVVDPAHFCDVVLPGLRMLQPAFSRG